MAGGTGCIGKLAGRMQEYTEQKITEMPLRSPFFKKKVCDFLVANGLREDVLDAYFCILDEDGGILAGAGIHKDIIKCVAVSSEARSGGLVAPVVSHILQWASERGMHNLKVFTKPENRSVFESLGFHVIASAQKAILMENGRGLESYCQYLASEREEGSGAVIVMNANPFHRGHLFLIQRASAYAKNVYVIVVKEDVSRFPYSERLAMVKAGIEGQRLGDCRVKVLEGSSYQISSATFPSYFLKSLDDVAPTQMELDLDLFSSHIAPALGASVRVVGSEQNDPLTGEYNATMKRLLPESGMEVKEIQRLMNGPLSKASAALSGSEVRECLDSDEHFIHALELSPVSSYPYLVADRACWSLVRELDTELKPGLVGPDSNGAHADMDYPLMKRSIQALRPYFACLALACWKEEPAPADVLVRMGKDAEAAMLAATGGVNTHRGAIYALGLAVSAFMRGGELAVHEDIMQKRLADLAASISSNSRSAQNLKDARAMAESGYSELFESWLPFYRSSGRSAKKTLLKIMSTLDDTCVIHRVGESRSLSVKKEAEEMLQSFSEEGLRAMCEGFAKERISPGGAADMLALTIFIDSIML